MKQRTILVAGVGAGACVGFVLGLILPPAGPAHVHDSMRGDTTSFYAEIATANARMHQAMSVAPPQLIEAHLGLDPQVMRALRKEKAPVVPA
jgi:hypothetical protein